VKAATSDPKVASEFDKYYGPVRTMKGYADFVNPFTEYVEGAFYLGSGDRADADTARQRFNRLRQMVGGPASAFVEADFAAADGLTEGRPVPPTTWVFLLDGTAPTKEQFRIPVPYSIKPPKVVTVAFPYLVMHNDSVSGLVAHGGTEARSGLLADVDSMVGAEFNQQLPGIIIRQVVGQTIKAVAADVAGQKGGAIARLGFQLVQVTTMSADVRIWKSLPKKVEVLRVPTPESGSIDLGTGAGRQLAPVSVVPGACNMVFVTCPTSAAPPSVTSVVLGDHAAAPVPAPQPEVTAKSTGVN
jgi:hypothetical protein